MRKAKTKIISGIEGFILTEVSSFFSFIEV